MPVGEWKTLTIRTELKEKLHKSFEQDEKKLEKQSFSSWFEKLLSQIVDNDERIRKYGRFLEVLSFNDNHILIDDHFQNGRFFVEISTRPGAMLFCQEEESTVCMHVGFCLALPEVYKALIKKGYTPMRLRKAKQQKKSKESKYDEERESDMLRDFTNPEDA